MIGKGSSEGFLSAEEVRRIFEEGRIKLDCAGKSLLFIIPDDTRTCPMPFLFKTVCDVFAPYVSKLGFLIALGTHKPMSAEALEDFLGISREEIDKNYGNVEVFNHDWENTSTFREIGTIPEEDISSITDGLFSMEVPVALNKAVFEYDKTVILGPVFPHEVVGFSGGYKYLFPGIGEERFIGFFHWLGAVKLSSEIIGTIDTPVRDVINRAGKFLSIDIPIFSFVVHGQDIHCMYFGGPDDAWRRAAEIAEATHIRFIDRRYKSILAEAPPMYKDIWTAAKCMYKMETAVEDGGELIIYAPHVKEISFSHGEVLDEVGYHVRDYFAKQWDDFKKYPWGVLAHSTHVKGIGTFEDGKEKPRINVILATGIPEERCKKVNLGYMDPEEINPSEWDGREKEGRLYVSRAGETLYRLK